MDSVDIFYIATGVYTTYFNDFLETLPMFLPGVKKRLHIISDLLSEYDGYDKDGIEINVIYQLDLPYPIIPLLKTHFIKSYMPEDAEYVFYFDADTIFMEKEPEYWEQMKEDIKDNFLATNHPGNFYPLYGIDEESEANIPYGTWYFTIMSSLYGAKKDTMLKFCEQMGEKIRKDLNHHKDSHQHHYIPSLFDQDYMNKTVLDSDGISFIIKYYSYISWFSNHNDRREENFVEQKYDISRKFKKKNME